LFSFSQGTWINFDTSNGLANNETLAILEDNSGNMWFSWKDITKYDGTNWTIYDTILPYHYFRDIAEDNNGNLWFASDGGILEYDGVSWIAYCDTIVGGYHLRSWTICADSYGNIWCGSSVIFKFNGSQWLKYDSTNSNLPLPNGDLRDIMEDNEGNIWFCGNGMGIFKYDGINWSVYDYNNGELPENYWIRVLTQDTLGNLWFGTYSSGIIKYDGSNWTQYNTSNGLLNNNAYGLAIDNQNNIWQGILYDNGGVCKFDGISSIYYDVNDGLINNYIFTVYKDKTGNLWFGTEGGVSELILNTGIAEQENTQPIINFYPNPNNGHFTFEREKDDLNITILNVNGQVVYSKQFEKKTPHTIEHIDLSNQAKGLYFVKIQSLKTTKVEKLIIQ